MQSQQQAQAAGPSVAPNGHSLLRPTSRDENTSPTFALSQHSDMSSWQRLSSWMRTFSSSGRLAVLACSVNIFWMGGEVFGFSSLFPVLYRELVLLDTCNDSAVDQCVTAMEHDSNLGKSCCSSQLLQFTLMSSVALFSADGVMVLCACLPEPARFLSRCTSESHSMHRPASLIMRTTCRCIECLHLT
eukprot:6175810-Pleurochrysis_carterae.AAC.3